ncbi:MAG: multiubiquitin domain-containing protein [Spirochaetota bacterium]
MIWEDETNFSCISSPHITSPPRRVHSLRRRVSFAIHVHPSARTKWKQALSGPESPPILDHFLYYIFIGVEIINIEIINKDVCIANNCFPALSRHESKRLSRTNQGPRVIDHRDPTGRELLTVVGSNPPEGFRLYQKLHGGMTKRVELDEEVDLATPGVERFKTLPLDATEG